MDKVKIKRVKRVKKQISTKEKILAGLGVGSTLLGGIGAVSSQSPKTQFVRTVDDETLAKAKDPGNYPATDYDFEHDNREVAQSKTSKLKQALASVFGGGIKQAEAAVGNYTVSIQPNGSATANGINGQNPTPEITNLINAYNSLYANGSLVPNARQIFDSAVSTAQQGSLSTQNAVDLALVADALMNQIRLGVDKSIESATAPILLNSLPVMTLNQRYSTGVISSGSISELSVSSGQLPPGVSLAGNVGIDGIPRTPGTYTFTLTAVGENGERDSKSYTMTVLGSPLVTNFTLKDLRGNAARDNALMPGYAVSLELGDPGAVYTGVNLILPGGRVVSVPGAQISRQRVNFNFPDLTNIKDTLGITDVRVELTGGPSGFPSTMRLKWAQGADLSFFAWGQLSTSMISQVRDAAGKPLSQLTDREIATAVLRAMGEDGQNEKLFGNSDADGLDFIHQGGGSTQALRYISQGVPQAPSLADVVGRSFYQAMVADGASATTPQITTDSYLSQFTINNNHSVHYESSFFATGFPGAITWTVESGSLPPGLNLESGTGRIYGDPTTPGNYTFVLKATSGQASATKSVTILINGQNVVATNPPLVSAVDNNQLMAGGAPVNIRMTGSNLTGATIAATQGFLNITNVRVVSDNEITASISASASATSGLHILTVTANGRSMPVNFYVTAAEAGYITGSTTHAPINEGQTFDYSYTTNIPGATWSVTSGQLPPGLTFTNGRLSGTVTRSGDYGFTIEARNGIGTVASKNVALQVVQVTAVNQPYVSNVTGNSAAKGQTVILTVNGNYLNGGVISSLDSNVFTVTPGASTANSVTATVAVSNNATPGNYNLRFLVGGQVTTIDFTVTQTQVANTLTISTPTLPGGRVGTAYSQTLTATGATGVTWSLASGSLPAGLSLSSAGVISGTPSAAATSTFTVKASAAGQTYVTKQFTIIVSTATTTGAAPTITSAATLPSAQVGVAYNRTLTGTNVSSWAVTTGTLPAGLSLSSAGVISGTPTTAKTTATTFTVTATGNGQTVNQAFTIPSVIPAASTGNPGATTTTTLGNTNLNTTTPSNPSGGTPTYVTSTLFNTTTGGGGGGGSTTTGGGSLFNTTTGGGTGGATTTTNGTTGTGSPISNNLDTSTGNASISTAGTLPSGRVGEFYQNGNFKLVAICPTSNIFQWSITEGRLPAGMTLAFTGELRGTPTQSGTFTFRAQATSQIGLASASRVFTITIAPESATSNGGARDSVSNIGNDDGSLETDESGATLSTGARDSVSGIGNDDGSVEVTEDGSGVGGTTLYRDSASNIGNDDGSVEVFEDSGSGSSGQSSSLGSGSGGSTSTGGGISSQSTSTGGGIAFGSSGSTGGSSSSGASASGSGSYYSGGSGGSSVRTFENAGTGASGNLLTYQNGNVQGSSQDGVLDIYTVKKGDTLWEIARSYYGDPTLWFKIQEANPGKVPNVRTMRIGTQLIIPNLGVQGNNGQAQTFDRSSNSSSTVLGTETVSPRGTYTVKQGDSLWSIAQKTYGSGSNWRKILSANPRSLAVSGDVKTLKVGFVLNLPDVSVQAATEQDTQTNNIQTFERAAEQTNNVSNISTEAASNVQTAASTANQTQSAQPIYRDSVSNIGSDLSKQDGEVEVTE